MNKKRRCEGNTLIEAVTALAIFGMSVGGACQLSLHTKMLGDQARWHYQSIGLAKNRMERIRVLPFHQIEGCVEDRVRVDRNGVADEGGHFRRTTTVNSLGMELKEVQISVETLNRVTLEFDGEGQEVRSFIPLYRTEPT